MTLTGSEGELERIYRTFGEILRDSMIKIFPDNDPDEAVEIYRSYHRNNFGERIKVFPGMRELLAELKSRGIKTAVVTSRAGVTTIEGLESYGLLEYFDALVTCDDTDRHKPDPAPARIALQKLDSKPENAIMIGDSMYDILCARNAGIKSVNTLKNRLKTETTVAREYLYSENIAIFLERIPKILLFFWNVFRKYLLLQTEKSL